MIEENKYLADMISTAARKGAELKQLDPSVKMCNDCAFKKGTDANNDPEAVEAAFNCLAYFGEFNCHHTDQSGDFKDAGHPCAGYLYAKKLMDHIDKVDNEQH
jgi:hypothetical protein